MVSHARQTRMTLDYTDTNFTIQEYTTHNTLAWLAWLSTRPMSGLGEYQAYCARRIVRNPTTTECYS